MFMKNPLTPAGASCSELLTVYYSGDQIKEDEMGRACGTHGERRSACRVGNLRERNRLEDIGVNGGDNIKMKL